MIMKTKTLHPNPTVQIPPRNHLIFYNKHEMAAYDNVGDYEHNIVPVDTFACDHFRMYEFKIRMCSRAKSHDWIDCPYAHTGEKARRRDPRKYHYSGDPCPEFRNGTCGKGDACEFAHGVFECWLHPSRYRTQPCKDGVKCHRKICFFAHSTDQLRVNSVSQTESLTGQNSVSELVFSVPNSPDRLRVNSVNQTESLSSQNSVNELMFSVRDMEIGNTTRLMSMSLINGSGFCSTRSLSRIRPGFVSLPCIPTKPGADPFEQWDDGIIADERIMERVESGKEIRAKIYAKLCRENSLADRVGSFY
ncbi:putative transcription factor C3H family [Helianthus annuus]|nr:putative transcription factor C3H family [Helianthus annuus]